MPLYEYVCGKCGQKTEVIQRVGEAPLKTCPHCGGRVKKAISAPAIQFKGSGWYVTDYARAKDSGGGRGAKDGGDKSADGGEKSDKSDKTEKSDKNDSGKSSKSEKSDKNEKSTGKSDSKKS